MDRTLVLDNYAINFDYVKYVKCSKELCCVVIRGTGGAYDSHWCYTKTANPESYRKLKSIVEPLNQGRGSSTPLKK
jgi:hypothetical protein